MSLYSTRTLKFNHHQTNYQHGKSSLVQRFSFRVVTDSCEKHGKITQPPGKTKIVWPKSFFAQFKRALKHFFGFYIVAGVVGNAAQKTK